MNITGVKPDESSNRKIVDNVLPPSDINPSIATNLSNTIMKAMAMEKHLRFSNVKEFLSAVNGNRKVIELKVERRNRKLKQVMLIVMSILIVAAAAVVLNSYYESKREEVYLPDAKITVWYISDEDGDKDRAMDWIIHDEEHGFTSPDLYPNVTVELKSFPEDEYYIALDEAAAKGELPTLFESTNASETVLNMASDINVAEVLASESASDCLFLDQYGTYYHDLKKIPLAIEVPMVCVITSGFTTVDYDKNTFDSLSDFNTNVISLDDAASSLADKNFDREDYASMDGFMNAEGNTSAVLVTSTMRINDLRNIMGYKKLYTYPSSKEIECNFVYEWSICSSDRNQKMAAERLLSWMLGYPYQTQLMIWSGNGEIPINKKAYEDKLNIDNENNKLYSGIAGDAYKRFKFKNEFEGETG